MPRLSTPLVAALTLTAGLAVLAPAGIGADAPALPCAGFQVVPTQGPSCPIEGGWRVLLGDGDYVETHGPDPLMAGARSGGVHGSGSGKSSAPACVSDPSWQFHNVLVYAVAADRPDRGLTMAPLLRDLAGQANAFLRQESSELGLPGRYKFRCDSPGVPTVLLARLPTADAETTFATIVRDLRAQGIGSAYAKHWVWYDGTRGGVSGEATLWTNDKLTSANRNARGNDFAVTYGVLDAMVMVHESAHNLGAVQLTAPHTTGFGHCTDGLDVMCYFDNPDAAYDPTVCGDRMRLDCNHDDYFHPDPPEGSWLATHWNLGHRFNRFLDFGRANAAPVVLPISCAPAVVDYDQPTTCKVFVDDDSDGVTYAVSVDGAPATRAPASGWAIAGVALTLTPSWSALGEHSVTVVATDDGGTKKPLSSAPVTATVRVGCAFDRAGNLTGVMGTPSDSAIVHEAGVPRACGGVPFTLAGALGADVDLCWEGPSGDLACFTALGDERGVVPPGAVAARLWLKAGASAAYQLTAG